MKIAVCLYKYFPFGGLARDFIRIMDAALSDNEEVDVFVLQWQGDIPKRFNVTVVPTTGWANHKKLQSYIEYVQPKIKTGHYDLVIGFNKMPGLDLYYAADPCYLDRIKQQSFYWLLKFTGRVKFYSQTERAVFGMESKTVSLMISDVQHALFKQHYKTPDDRLIALPPGIDRNRKRAENANEIRTSLRHNLSIKENEWLLLMVGTGFKTKGVDRAISALAELPDEVKQKVKLFVVGEGDDKALCKMAKNLGLEKQLHFLGGRSDVPDFLIAADLLIHPARKENTGTVLLEAIVAGLPVLVSDVCGYAKHVVKAEAGKVLTNPSDAAVTANDLLSMLQYDLLEQYSKNALVYAEQEDLYSMPERVAQIIHHMAAVKHKEDSV